MKVLILNGSPRKNGNTAALLNRISETLSVTKPEVTVETIELDRRTINPCRGCDACLKNGGVCIQKDDGNELVEKVLEADAIVLGSPVYWWGITAQLKIMIDRLYCLMGRKKIKPKKVGLVTVGADGLEGEQYKLISGQYKCIFNYLQWEVVFDESVSANKPGEVLDDTPLMLRMGNLAGSLLQYS